MIIDEDIATVINFDKEFGRDETGTLRGHLLRCNLRSLDDTQGALNLLRGPIVRDVHHHSAGGWRTRHERHDCLSS